MILYFKRAVGLVLVSTVFFAVFGQTNWTMRRVPTAAQEFNAVSSMAGSNVIAGQSMVTSPDSSAWVTEYSREKFMTLQKEAVS